MQSREIAAKASKLEAGNGGGGNLHSCSGFADQPPPEAGAHDPPISDLGFISSLPRLAWDKRLSCCCSG
jgi:hypothetical protein